MVSLIVSDRVPTKKKPKVIAEMKYAKFARNVREQSKILKHYVSHIFCISVFCNKENC